MKGRAGVNSNAVAEAIALIVLPAWWKLPLAGVGSRFIMWVLGANPPSGSRVQFGPDVKRDDTMGR